MIPKKPALGLDPRMDAGFRITSCSATTPPLAIPLTHNFIYLSAVPIGRFRVRYGGSFCRAGYMIGEAVIDPTETPPAKFAVMHNSCVWMW
jgi:hypothetical protein